MKYHVKKLVSNVEGEADNLDTRLKNGSGLVIYQNQLWVAVDATIEIPKPSGGTTFTAFTRVYDKSGVLQKEITSLASSDIAVNNSKGFVISKDGSTASSEVLTSSNFDQSLEGYNSWVNPDETVKTPALTDSITGISMKDEYLYSAERLSLKTYDFNYKTVPFTFVDPSIPEEFKPFNVVVMKSKVFVTYAKKSSGEIVRGKGFGYVSVFNLDGTFIKTLIKEGELNAPWGFVKTPKHFGYKKSFIVGNYGDGTLNVYDKYGNFIEKLKDKNGVITIKNLYGLVNHCDKVYFASSPDTEEEQNGLVGLIEPKYCHC